ncbi:MAG: hypothetical protein KAI47_17120 [Deltaproteobacteria bacterium]|nr:hypothetical protein [Deltaproteobacteria bacterium]
MSCHVYLVPGFFGFSSLGSLSYFRGVGRALRGSLSRRGIDAEVIECSTRPTGFVKYRARDLLEQVLATGGAEADELHFVGHSTGGLDVRQLLTPSVQVEKAALAERIGRLTRSATLVSTPHRGTPLAQFFCDIRGRETLRVLASEASTRGRLAIVGAARLLDAIASLDDAARGNSRARRLLWRRVLRRIPFDEGDPVWSFLRQIEADQGSMLLLTTEWMDHFNAAVEDRATVRYGSVVTGAPSPLGRGLWGLLRQGPLGLGLGYAILYALVAWTPSAPSRTPLPPGLLADLRRGLSLPVHAQTNDGVVPTLSQLYGTLIATAEADHADIVGQFRRWGSGGRGDWLPSGADFDEGDFSRVWDAVAAFIVESGPREHGVRAHAEG